MFLVFLFRCGELFRSEQATSEYLPGGADTPDSVAVDLDLHWQTECERFFTSECENLIGSFRTWPLALKSHTRLSAHQFHPYS